MIDDETMAEKEPLLASRPHGVLEPDVHFIGKPYSLATLSAKIRAILDQPR